MNKEFLSQIPSDEQPVAHKLLSLAEDIQVSPAFQTKLETQLRETHNEAHKPIHNWQTKILPSLGWAILIVGAVLLLNWALRSLVPKPIPAANGTPNPSLPTESHPAPVIEESVPTPSGTEYDWRGIKLYLNAALPATPAEVGLYQAQPEQPATPDSARALAAQFGMNGELYESPPEIPISTSPTYLVVDGNQRLDVRSNLYFSYYPDYTRWATGNSFGQNPEEAIAREMIDTFMRSHGFNFDYKVIFSEFYTGYYALPFTPDGFTIQHEHFDSVGCMFRFDKDGIVAVEASLADYTPVEKFGIISAEDAFQKVLDLNTMNGVLEGMHSYTPPADVWSRSYP